MSFILNALRKSEQERQAKQNESFDHRILEKDEGKKKRIPYWLVVLVLANIVFLLFFVWSFVGEKKQTGDPAKQQGINTLVEIIDVDRDIAADKEKRVPSTVLKTELKSSLPQLSIADKIIQQQSKQPKVVSNLKNNHTKNKKTKISKSISTKEEKESITFIRSNKKTEPEKILKKVDNFDKKQRKLPFLSELSYDFRRTVAKVEINVFVYSENENKRFIMINMQKHLAGQEISEGMVLKEIRVDSIVVKFNNKVFKIKR